LAQVRASKNALAAGLTALAPGTFSSRQKSVSGSLAVEDIKGFMQQAGLEGATRKTGFLPPIGVFRGKVFF
jgi:hypothetical protein